MYETSTIDLLLWINKVEKKKEDLESLYLLLDLLGGISKKDLTLIKLKSIEKVNLKENLNNLKAKWLDHSQKSIPIQYICKSTYWRNFKFELNSNVLIPRVETEQIVEIANNIINNQKNIIFADLGTGSGAIAISLANTNKNWKGLATDIDENVLRIAKKNYQNNQISTNLKFICGSWCNPLMDFKGMIDIVIANPPYIPLKVYEDLPYPVKNFEPMLALCGGKDGLKHIREIIAGAPKILRRGGWIILENHFDQSLIVKSLLKENGFDSTKTINDFFGIGRFTIGRYK
tara:strand:+ start:247 stop:1113 length:867 start_codon:yes stop_codon:yes gene_type:complete